MSGVIEVAKEVISKIEHEEQEFENLIEREEKNLKLNLDEFKFKMDEKVAIEREKNLNFYNRVVEEFKICVDRKVENFKSKVEDHCCELEENLKKDVSKAVEVILSKFLRD